MGYYIFYICLNLFVIDVERNINDIFINVIVEVKKNMRGYFEFCLCFEVLELVLVMYVCLDKYYLEIEGYGK